MDRASLCRAHGCGMAVVLLGELKALSYTCLLSTWTALSRAVRCMVMFQLMVEWVERACGRAQMITREPETLSPLILSPRLFCVLLCRYFPLLCNTYISQYSCRLWVCTWVVGCSQLAWICRVLLYNRFV